MKNKYHSDETYFYDSADESVPPVLTGSAVRELLEESVPASEAREPEMLSGDPPVAMLWGTEGD